MSKPIYVVEEEATGNMCAFYNRNDAILYMLRKYLDTGFANIKDDLLDEDYEKDDVRKVFDYLEGDLYNLLDHNYIDGFMFMREAMVI